MTDETKHPMIVAMEERWREEKAKREAEEQRAAFARVCQHCGADNCGLTHMCLLRVKAQRDAAKGEVEGWTLAVVMLRSALRGLLEEAELEHPNWSLLERRCLDAEEALAATDTERLARLEAKPAHLAPLPASHGLDVPS